MVLESIAAVCIDEDRCTPRTHPCEHSKQEDLEPWRVTRTNMGFVHMDSRYTRTSQFCVKIEQMSFHLGTILTTVPFCTLHQPQGYSKKERVWPVGRKKMSSVRIQICDNTRAKKHTYRRYEWGRQGGYGSNSDYSSVSIDHLSCRCLEFPRVHDSEQAEMQ